MSYSTNNIPNLKTVKGSQGSPLSIDLGKTFDGTLTAWMKKEAGSTSYRSFDIDSNRFLKLTSSKTSDYYNDDVLIESIVGKWYFDVVQVLDPPENQDPVQIYKGVILFSPSITGIGGVELNYDPQELITLSEQVQTLQSRVDGWAY